jgi:hypothetical protein
MSTPLTARDPVAEKDFLASIRQLDFLLLQRDWRSVKHGDLDILLSGLHWSQFIDYVLDFSAEKNYPIAKAYEIEEGIVCMILITSQGRIHLDVALSTPEMCVFGVDTENALRRRDLLHSIPVAHPQDSLMYHKNKIKYKSSLARRAVKKILNMRVILRRIANGIIFVHGGIFYIPFVRDFEILRSRVVVAHNEAYLQGTLRSRYCLRRSVPGRFFAKISRVGHQVREHDD